VNDLRRNIRLRQLVRQFNKQRKKQRQQIDILCNDIISAQKDFIKSLKIISFAADFYGSIIGSTELNDLLCMAGNLIQKHIPDVYAAFFLVQTENFELHVFENEQPLELDEKRIENLFTTEIASAISESNHVCTIDDMLEMGLQCSPIWLDKISMAAMPLSTGSSKMGFLLIYRSSKNPLNSDELKSITQIMPGLARSIASCRLLSAVNDL